MPRHLCAILAVTCFGICMPLCGAADTYMEDFTTMDNCDTTNTTAWWDTVGGEIKLPPFTLTLAGAYTSVSNSVRNVAISGNYAYVACMYNGLRILDISDPTNPGYVGAYNTPGSARAVALRGDYAFVADGASGLCAIDVSNPASPAFVDAYDTPGLAMDVAIDGPYAFVADLSDGLVILDIQPPDNIWSVGGWNSPGSAYGVAISGNYAYIADHEEGLQIVDITSVEGPSYVGSYNTPNSARDVAVAGDVAYVADGDKVLVLDISSPSSPSLMGSYQTPNWCVGVAVEGDYAYVCDSDSGLHVLDVSDPASPTLKYTYRTPDDAYAVMVAGEHAYVATDYAGLLVIDIADVVAPPVVAGRDITPTFCLDVAVSGDYAYMVLADNTFRVMDISDPLNPSYVASCGSSPTPYAVAVSGDYAFVAGEYLSVIDISDPTSPSPVEYYGDIGGMRDIAISGGRAYVTGWDMDVPRLQILNITVPTHVVGLGYAEIPGAGRSVAVSGDYAYVGTESVHAGKKAPESGDSTGFVVFNIANSWFPYRLGYCEPTNTEAIETIVIADDYAYVSGGPTVYVVDISDPLDPTRIAALQADGWSLAMAGDYLFGSGYGLDVIDISDPENPSKLGDIDTWPDEWTMGIDIAGAYVFAAAESSLHVFEVFQSDYDLDANQVYSLDVAPDWDVVRVRLWPLPADTGTIHWSVWSDSLTDWAPVEPGSLWTTVNNFATGLKWRAELQYDRVWLEPICWRLWIEYDGYSSGVADRDEASTFALSVPAPNPFGSTATVHFTLPSPQEVRLGVYDVLGRRIALLADGRYGAGAHLKRWDGTDAAGRRVSSGSYYIRLEAGDLVDQHKMILLR